MAYQAPPGGPPVYPPPPPPRAPGNSVIAVLSAIYMILLSLFTFCISLAVVVGGSFLGDLGDSAGSFDAETAGGLITALGVVLIVVSIGILATAVGVYAVLGWPVVLLWCVLWAAGNFFLRRVNPANALATVLVMAFILAVPESLLALLVAGDPPLAGFRIISTLLLIVILVKHAAPVREYLKERGGRVPADGAEPPGRRINPNEPQ